MYMDELDRGRLRDMQMKIMENVAASALIPLMRIGDELGLFTVLADKGPMDIKSFAAAAEIDARYCEEWVLAMCAAGYCSHNEAIDEFYLSPEQKAVFAYEDSPALMIGAYDLLSGNIHSIEDVREAFKTGGGVDYGRAHPCIFQGTARFFKPSYATNLVTRWLPKVEGAEDVLNGGGSFADIGCGFGISTQMVAESYPNAKVFGFDIHEPSIEAAKRHAAEAGFEGRIDYQAADAKSYEGSYDILAFFDCLHDMGDPLGAARHAAQHLNDDGTVILIEPSASDERSDNMNTIGQMYYSFSTMGCVPTSKSQEVGLALGAQAGPKKLIGIMNEAGFSRHEIVFKNASNMVIACRK